MKEIFPFDPCRFGRIHDDNSHSKAGVENWAVGSFGKLPQLRERDDWGNKAKRTDGLLFSTEYHQAEQERLHDLHNLDALFPDTPSPFQSYEHRIQELTDIESEYSELIKPCPHPKSTNTPDFDAVCHEARGDKLSTNAIIRLGGEWFIQSCSLPSHAYGGSFCSLNDQDTKDVELVQNLLLSAEKVSQQQFERATKLLDWCDALSSSTGNPVQRLVHYFSQALREKIAGETGRISFHGSGTKHIADIEGKMLGPNPSMISVYQKLPFIQAGKFAGVQALVDGVAGAAKVHIIDLSIKNGIQGTILMQALVSRADHPIKHLKITAVTTKLKQKIEETGDRLKSFAESLNLSFSFEVVTVGDMLDFKEELLELDPEEALAVYSSYGLWSMIVQPDRLESLMKVVKNINPRVMVVLEAAANLNSPNFVNRFIEALFYYGAIFDSLEDCMDREDQTRAVTESVYFGSGILSVVAKEGEERVVRLVNIDVWRKFFARFGMEEVELSMSSLYQADLMVEKFRCGSSCTSAIDGKCLVIGWKGTPVQSLSAWKFS